MDNDYAGKKSLGQHFLQSKAVIDALLEAGEVDSHDSVIEAGPGKGVLTEALLVCAREVIAVEKDPRLVMYLRFKFKKEISEGKLKLIEGDILEFDASLQGLRPGGYKVLANIPYYITGQFLRHFLSGETPPSRMVLLLQKEVAKRIVAEDGKESVLSISVKTYGVPSYIQTVGRDMFTPKPKVDSAVLLIRNISKDFFRNVDEKKFFELLKGGFAQKRKKLINNLSNFLPKEKIQKTFEGLSIDQNARAEELPPSKWKALIRFF